MTRRAGAPGPLVLLGLGALVLAFSVEHPAPIVALAIGAVALLLTAPRAPSRLYLIGGAISGIGLIALNPFVTGEGEHILFRGPRLTPFDTEITVEELAAGAVGGVRVFAVAVLVGALLSHVDADRLQARVARVAPRSALMAAMSARLLPALERDSRAIVEVARMRGARLGVGSWHRRARAAAPLALPLLGSGMERGLDIAEAMTARGYGAGPRTRTPEPPLDRRQRMLWIPGVLAVVVAAAALITGSGAYTFYPLLDPLLQGGAALLALLAALALGAAAWLSR